MIHFEAPWAFVLLLLVPVGLVVAIRWRKQRSSLRFSTVAHANQLRPTLRLRLLSIPLLLRLLAIILLVVVLARPQEGRERVVDVSKGVAMEIVIDRSSSMNAEMGYGREQLNRLEVVKKVSEEFAMGNDSGLAGRPNDLIGLITFAHYADTVCPLTLGHGALSEFINKAQLVQRRSEDGTAIGDAIALAAARLHTAEETLARQTGKAAKDYEIKSKVIILFTDGQNNIGSRTPDEAAAMAKEWGIKIYAIGAGGDQGLLRQQGLFGSFLRRGGDGVDKATLSRIAAATNGLFRMAEDDKALRAIYKEIDALERSEVESIRFLDYREQFQPFLLAVLGLLALEMTLTATIFRRIP